MRLEPADRTRVIVYLVVAFGFSWGVAAVVWATGGLAGTEIAPGIPLSLPLITVSMFGPALGNVVARITTKEGWDDLRLRFSGPGVVWLVVWPGFVLAAVVGVVAYFALFPGQFDPSMPALTDQLAETGVDLPVGPGALAVIQLVAASLIAPFVNAIPAFGEEFGWRGYLQWKLRPLGWYRMLGWMGLIWGVWHFPLIALGYNYGDAYPGFPWLGMAVFLVFTTAVGSVLAWAAERTGSCLPAAFGHGVVNAVAGLGALYAVGNDLPLLGPAVVGLVAGVGFVLLAVLVARKEPVPAEA